MANQNKIPDFLGMADQLMQDLIIDAEVMGMKFIESNFEKEGFMDGSFQGWAGRKTPISYSILRVTNSLFNSINASNDGKSKVIFTADMPYASIHNEGGILKIPRTKKMKSFFWAMYKRTSEEKWKWMAMSNKPHVVFRIPKRQYMGKSKTFDETFDRHVVREILSRFKNIKHK
jgi:phage gpG-like protein